VALIAVAADKGAPGVTTACVALAAVWPRPVLLAECDPAGGDLACRLPAAGGGQLDPGRGLLSLAVAGRRGIGPGQILEHTQKLSGGLDVLAGVVTAEQGAGLELLWGPAGAALAQLPGLDVIADCGRIGADGPHYDLLASAATVVLVTRDTLAEVVRLRERAAAVTAALAGRHRNTPVAVVVIAGNRRFHTAIADVGRALSGEGRYGGNARVIGGLAYDPPSAEALGGAWGGRLNRSLLLRTARDVAGRLAAPLPAPVAIPAGRG
jgi:MinD-like ATPase involved in chromosome partitioning or flagellar assembly